MVFIKDDGDISHLVRFFSQCISALYPRLCLDKNIQTTTFAFETQRSFSA